MLFIVTLAGCVIAFCLMIVWIGLYWILTQLLFMTATLLRTVYEEPTAIEHTPEAKEELHAEDGENVTHSSNVRYGLHLNLHFGR